MIQNYPSLFNNSDISDIAYVLRQIVRIRSDDLQQWSDLNNTYIKGRLVGKIPSSPSDVVFSDRVGDTSFDAGYQYTLVDNGGTPAWDRRTLNTSW